VTQGALSVALLIGAALFVRSLARAGEVPLGYDVDPIGLIYLENRGARLQPAERVALRARVLEAVRAHPDVERAAWSTNTPRHGTSTTGLVVPGIDSVAALGRFTYQAVDSGYFGAIGTRIVRGRGITATDRTGTPRVAVVSDAMARALWPGRDALGQCVRVGFFPAKADTMPCTTVVGVAENVVNNFTTDYPYRYYLPEEQLEIGVSLLIVRMRGEAARSIESVRRTAQSVLPGLGYAYAETLADLDARDRRSWRLGAAMFVSFGVLALIVAAVGLYGVISYTVAQRQHELGVRVALGARRGHVARMVVGQGVRYALGGVIAGSLIALVAARFIQPLLFHQSATDPAVFAFVSAVLLAVAAMASFIPALRAMRADPASALRAE
jgi:predicted permease